MPLVRTSNPYQKDTNMQIVLNTDEALSDLDKEILSLVLGGDVAPAKSAAAPRTRAAAAKKEPEPEPEDLLGGDAEVTMDDAVAAATKIISAGKQADLKTILTGFNVKKVGELKDADLADFVSEANQVDLG